MIKKRFLTFLALLCLTVSGAWAQSALTGAFTINADGDQVQFSSGNLQATYNGTNWSWAFAANQWDYIGNAAGNTSINGNGSVSANNVTVDLFGWVGASSTWTGAAQYGISNSTTTKSTSTYGNVVEEALKSDWGNTIGSGWRTLTNNEWTYLFNTRTSGSTVNSTSNARYTHATINTDGTGVNGMILFPDGVTIANGEATSWGKINGNSSWGTKCTSAQWTALAAKGCVFLPAAGYRTGSSVSNAGTHGRYWSSLPYTVDASTTASTKAYRVYFISNSLYPASNDNRNVGHSVRLVKTYETPAYTVTLKEGTDDADNWTITPPEAKTTGVAEGTEITATYSGTKLVKSVKAVKKPGPAATVTTAPTATTGDIAAGSETALVSGGTAEGGTVMYAVTTDATQPTSTDGFSADVPTAEGLTAGTYYVWYYVKADASHSDSEIAGPVSVTVAVVSLIVNPVVGQIIGSDGKNYDANATLPTGVTAVAMIAYLGNGSDCTNGLAIQLNSSPVTKTWSDAKTYASGFTAVPGGTWRLPSKADWLNMFLGCSKSGDASQTDSDNALNPIQGFKEKITAAGVTWPSVYYWSSTASGSGAWAVQVYLADSWAVARFVDAGTANTYYVLGCLAF